LIESRRSRSSEEWVLDPHPIDGLPMLEILAEQLAAARDGRRSQDQRVLLFAMRRPC
jgi:hypothetical protein